jgi:hypothetical protein
MPSAFRNPKNLADWLRLDYFRYPRGLPRWRRILCWGALLVCVAGLGAAVISSREPRLYEAGPLSSAHAMFSNDCAQCHQDNFSTAQRFLPWKTDVHSVPDSACLKCHDGPLHNGKLKGPPEHCATCHQEHRGTSLVRLPDSRCLTCHRDLKANSTDGAKCPFGNVTEFPAGHPEFNLPDKDPGTIKFDHWKHVSLNPESMAKLDCKECHQPDTAGRYMQPVKYDPHCVKCHPLSVQLGGTFDGKASEAAVAFARDPAPHREPAIVRGALVGRLLDFAETHPLGAGTGPEDDGVPGPKAGNGPSLSRVRWADDDRADKNEFVRRQLAHMEVLSFDRPGGCALCHTEPNPHEQGKLPTYATSNIPERWMKHSRFDHQAHRMLLCTECHAVTAKSVQSSDVMMPLKQTCANCHNPSAGARNDCMECHTYHPRDHGSDPQDKHRIDELLRK